MHGLSQRIERGFTLVELLITISIIGVVFGIVLTSANAIQKQSRDGQRQSDLRSIQSALQQYYADAKFYPSTIPTNGSAITSSTGRADTPPSPVKTYLNKTPVDPVSGNYTFTKFPSTCDNSSSTNRCTNYCLAANLENNPSSIVAPAPCVVAGSDDLYVTQP